MLLAFYCTSLIAIVLKNDAAESAFGETVYT